MPASICTQAASRRARISRASACAAAAEATVVVTLTTSTSLQSCMARLPEWPIAIEAGDTHGHRHPRLRAATPQGRPPAGPLRRKPPQPDQRAIHIVAIPADHGEHRRRCCSPCIPGWPTPSWRPAWSITRPAVAGVPGGRWRSGRWCVFALVSCHGGAGAADFGRHLRGGWIFQFIGHKIEGKKPSFFEDIQYLWVGPLFVVSRLFLGLGSAGSKRFCPALAPVHPTVYGTDSAVPDPECPPIGEPLA